LDGEIELGLDGVSPYRGGGGGIGGGGVFGGRGVGGAGTAPTRSAASIFGEAVGGEPVGIAHRKAAGFAAASPASIGPWFRFFEQFGEFVLLFWGQQQADGFLGAIFLGLQLGRKAGADGGVGGLAVLHDFDDFLMLIGGEIEVGLIHAADNIPDGAGAGRAERAAGLGEGSRGMPALGLDDQSACDHATDEDDHGGQDYLPGAHQTSSGC
jgi:hypothetical protein